MNKLLLATALSVLGSLTLGSDCDAQITFGAPTGRLRASTQQFRGSGRVVSLKDQLNAQLRTRRAVEKKFVDDVVNLVQTGRLPVKLVIETMQFSRRKPTRHPFQYFQRALSLRAARLGVTLRTV